VVSNFSVFWGFTTATAFGTLSGLIEVGSIPIIFARPRHQLTEDYITGRFG
jgi:phosphate transport system ATP-binding protein